MGKIIDYIPKPIRGLMALGLLFLLLGFLRDFGSELAAFMAWYVNFNYFGIGLNDALSLIVKIFAWIIPIGVLVIIRMNFEVTKRWMVGLFDALSFAVTVLLTYLFKIFQDHFWWFFGIGLTVVILLTIFFLRYKNKERKHTKNE